MKITNRFNLPQVYVNAVGTPYPPKPNRIGVTALVDSPLIRKLTIDHWDELEQDVSDMVWLILGNAVHYLLEQHAPEDSFEEEKMIVPIGDITLAGKSDIYHLENIEDYKVTSVWSFLLGAKPQWEAQLNIYKWMWEKANFKVKSLSINAILRDWQKGKAKFDMNYPQIPFLSLQIPMWTAPIVTEYIFDRLAYHAIRPTPECTPEEKWQRESTWAVMKGENKRATRVFDTEIEAKDYIVEHNTPILDFHVEARPGECVRCQDYCLVRTVCPYNKAGI
jgi:hypothetical protein